MHGRDERWKYLLGPFLVALPLVVLFAPVLFSDRTLAFRDTATFYYPLFEWIEGEWRAGRTPLWNPHLNYGTPIVGDSTSSVFYPGKLLFLLPLPFSVRFTIFIFFHFLLAAWSAFFVARKFDASHGAAILAATAYVCGGSVLFQYCNLVFLVGAAWLPLAFLAVARLGDSGSFLWAIALGVVLALMTLGGDPQTAYHVGLAATGWLMLRTGDAAQGKTRVEKLRALVRPLFLLATAAVVGGVLAAVQVLPSAEASRESERTAYHNPRNIYEAVDVARREIDAGYIISQGLFRDPEGMTHADYIYNFSFAPWHLLEYVWPNVSGRMYPLNRRWINVFPYEPRVWNVSIYMGLLPLIAMLSALRLRSGDSRELWLSWTTVLAVIASFGIYGVGWLIQGIFALFGQAQGNANLPGAQVGGLYWFFVVFLPGYAYFRFPAKLLTFAAFPMCLLAARGFDRWREEPSRKVLIVWRTLAIVSGLAAVALLFSGDAWQAFTSRLEPEGTFGPFDAVGARHDLIRTFLHTTLLAGIFIWTMNVPRDGRLSANRTLILILVTSVELVVANAPLMLTAPSEIWRERPLLATLLDRDRAQHGRGETPPRVRPSSGTDPSSKVGWQASSSPLRGEQYARSERHLANHNHHLAGPIEYVDGLASLRQADYAFWHKWHAKNEESYWGNYWLTPRNIDLSHMPQWEAIDDAEFTEATQCRLFRHRDPFPRAWIVHQVTQLPELHSHDPHRLNERGQQVLGIGKGTTVRRRDFRREAVIEFDGDLPKLVPPGDNPTFPARCAVTVDEPGRVVLECSQPHAGLLVLGDLYYPGWEAWEISGEPRPLPLYRTNRIFRGVFLDRGKHTVEFRYRSRSLERGLWISVVGWAVLVLGAVAMRFVKRNRPS